MRVLLALGLLALLLAQSPAVADGTSAPGSPSTVGECVAAESVWLHIQDAGGRALRSECVGRPSSGVDALAMAEVATTESQGGYLCTLAGEPEECPRRFDGSYWQYWHATAVGAEWTYSLKGPADRRPERGSLEGWCHVASGEGRCALPALAVDDQPARRVDAVPARRDASTWAVIVIVAVLGATVVALRRRGRTGRDPA